MVKFLKHHQKLGGLLACKNVFELQNGVVNVLRLFEEALFALQQLVDYSLEVLLDLLYVLLLRKNLLVLVKGDA